MPCSMLCSALPPHTRGCTSARWKHADCRRASPAHAGMYPATRRTASPSRRFPRTRGDVPPVGSAPARAYPLPPHTRGCTGIEHNAMPAAPASPAHAGMYPSATSSPSGSSGFPRTRGDVPVDLSAITAAGELPPHTRGCTPVVEDPEASDPASPAHAGMYPNPGCRTPLAARFPRTRGDVPSLCGASGFISSLPPHTRGCT